MLFERKERDYCCLNPDDDAMEEKKNKKSGQKLQVVALSLTILFCITYGLSFVDYATEIQAYMVEGATFVSVLLPLPTIVCWFIYIYQYFSAELNKQKKVQVYVKIVMIVLTGVVFLYCVLDFIHFVATKWSLLDRLQDCIAWNSILCIGWLLLLLYGIRSIKNNIKASQVIPCILVAFVLIGGMVAYEEYAKERVKDPFFDNLIEEFEEEYPYEG